MVKSYILLRVDSILVDKLKNFKKYKMKIRFKKMMLVILSLTILNVAKAQTEIQESGKKYSEIFDSLATGLIPSRIPYGKLNDRTAGWSGLAEWQNNNDTISSTQITLFKKLLIHISIS